MVARKTSKTGRARTRRKTGRLLTLSEVARRAGVSIPTAQAYKRKYQTRLPSVGSGRAQRYTAGAVAVFQRLREENAQRRGGWRGGRRAQAAKGTAASRPSNGHGGALSLAEIARRTRISYPTLLRYLQLHGPRIPSIGSGRKRRFPAQAVEVFEKLRGQSRGGRRRAVVSGGRGGVGSDPALSGRIQRIEQMQAELARQLNEIVRVLKQPLHVTIQPQ